MLLVHKELWKDMLDTRLIEATWDSVCAHASSSGLNSCVRSYKVQIWQSVRL